MPWIEKVYLARRSNLSGEPKANPINYGAEPDKLFNPRHQPIILFILSHLFFISMAALKICNLLNCIPFIVTSCFINKQQPFVIDARKEIVLKILTKYNTNNSYLHEYCIHK